MRVSIVINTYNRCASLVRTLAALRQLRYSDFEIIVVNGPSTDDTDALLAARQGGIKIRRCPIANLSVSRNIGIAAAAGEIVAFIDDDAIPDPQWLGNIVAGYDSSEIGGVGGFVYDSTGYEFQTRYIICDRFGGATTDNTLDPTSSFNAPGAPRYAAHLGTNTSFRRALLLEIGGFDEEFAYYLDETDVCLRIVDSGHVVKYVDDAFVYHKFGPSHLRNERKVLVTRYEILKSQAYFAFKHGARPLNDLAAMESVVRFVAQHRDEVEWCIANSRLPATARAVFEDEQRRAVHDGITRGMSAARTYLSRETLAEHAGPFKLFDRRQIANDRLTICLFTRQYPPAPIDGIGRIVYELAQLLAELGHTVHVLTMSETHNRVDLEDGVWVHRLAIAEHPRPVPDIPAPIWNYGRSLMKEVERIHRLDRVDVIQAPAWDSEGIAALVAGEIPVVTSLHTPMLVAASMHPDWLIDADKVQNTLVPLARWERRVMAFSDGLVANSAGIIDTIERAYDLTLDRNRTAIISHGLQDRMAPSAPVHDRDEIRVLFIGRLEYRKGIDLVIGALRALLPEYPQLRADIIGEDTTSGDEPDFARQFAEATRGAPWASQMQFHGRVEPERLDSYLADCDIFVAPSRFESFGLIYLEAMMFGKPVIASDAGGIGEVVLREETGLLVPPGDQEAFTAALRRLIESKELRERLGDAGRRRYISVFAARAMAERSIALYRSVMARPSLVRSPSFPAPDPTSRMRRCELADFWITSPLFPVLSTIGNGAIDRRLWAYCLLLETLRQNPGQATDGHRPSALIIADHPIPDTRADAPEWQVTMISTDATAPLDRRLRARLRSTEHFEVVACLAVLDPLEDGFEASLAELARLCALGGRVQILIAVGAGIARRAPLIADSLARAGLRAPSALAAFLESGPEDCAFCDDRVEPFLGILLRGEGRPVASLTLKCVAPGPGETCSLPSAVAAAR